MGPNFLLGRHTPTHFQGKNPPGEHYGMSAVSALEETVLRVGDIIEISEMELFAHSIFLT